MLATKDEALKMAIEALEHASERSIIINAYEEVINACKKALDLSEKQYTFPDELDIANCDLKQPAQEPVAWTTTFDTTNIWESPESPGSPFVVPLYTHPHQWQGLMDDDVQAMWKFYDGKYYDFYTAIEQALKEKNYD